MTGDDPRHDPHFTRTTAVMSAAEIHPWRILRNRSAWPMLLLPLVLLLGGCFGKDDSSGGDDVVQPFRGKTVTVAVPRKLGLAAMWDLTLREWSSVTRAEHRLVEYDATDELPARGDVLVVPLTALPDLVAADRLAARAESRPGIFHGLRERTASIGGEPTVIPVSCPVLVCYYRADLLEKAGLAPPRSWDEYQSLLDTLGEWAPGLTAVEPYHPAWRTTMFLARAASYAKPPGQLSLCFDVLTGRPLIDSPGFVEALAATQKAVRAMPAAVLSYTPLDCRREILEGRAALAIGMETGPEASPLPLGPQTKTPPEKSSEPIQRAEGVRLGVVHLPGATRAYDRSHEDFVTFPAERPHFVALGGFAGLCVAVARSAESTDAAWDLADHLTTENLPITFPPPLGGPVLESQVHDATAFAGRQLRPEEQAKWIDAVAATLGNPQYTSELPVVGRERFRAALAKELGPVLEGDAQPQEALRAAAAAWQAIVEEIGVEAVQESYRDGLGAIGS